MLTSRGNHALQHIRGDIMKIEVVSEFMGTVDGELVRGDKFLVRFSDDTEQTFKCCSFSSLVSILKYENRLSEVTYLADC